MAIFGTIDGTIDIATGAYPAIRPTLDLNFAQAKVLDPRVTFYRDSVGTYVDELGVIRTVPANVPRFDHDPATGQSLGLLIEESRTNLLLYSNGFNNSSFWGTANLTVSSTTETTSPDGTNNAWKLTEDSTNNFRYIASGVTMGATPHTASVWMKAGTRTQGSIFLTQGGNNGATFTLTGSGSFSVFGTGNSASIVPHPNGWYRCIVTNNGSADINDSIRIGIQNGANQAYQGDGSSAIYIWGAQVEAGSFATSYIPATASAVTRAADVAYISGTNFTSWYNQTESTIFSQFTTRYDSSNGRVFRIVNTSDPGSNRIDFVATSQFHPYIMTNLVQQASVDAGDLPANTAHKISSAWSTANVTSSIDGGAVATNAGPLTFFTANAIEIGYNSNSTTAFLNGTMSRLIYYPKRLTNTQLQNLTA